ncbi:MAG: hypothetical protein EXS14_09020 [Planctomycetes bacterium]|nr:hypothetical protein [Planctomycetota bacterium]
MFFLRSWPTLFLCFACAAVAVAPLHAQSSWPFGGSRSARAEGGGELDLWNLGLLGVKAREPGTATPPGASTGRRRVAAASDAPAADNGPDRLEVVLLFPTGPASKAGLLVGDVISGVNKVPFAKGSLDALASALLTAEAAERGAVVLDIARTGPKGVSTLALRVPILSMGKDALKPEIGEARKAIQKAALQWLAERQASDGGFSETLSGRNGSVVQAALAGLAWLAASDALAKSPWTQNIDKARGFVLRYALSADEVPRIDGANWDQTNWGIAHGLLFLAELAARKRASVPQQELERLVQTLFARMETSGGFAHGPGGKNALDYLELNIVGALVLSALGNAKGCGVAVDATKARRLFDYCEASASAEGGVGYSTAPGQKGEGNIGRSAAAWLGVRNLGFDKLPFTQKLESYVRSNAQDVLGGHASLMQHVLLSGVAAEALGGEVRSVWWARARRDLVLARAPDGSLQPRPWHESLQMNSNSDVSVGEVWTTACWAIVLGADPAQARGAGLPLWCGRKLKQ